MYIMKTLNREIIMIKMYNRLNILANFYVINDKHVLFKRTENTIKRPEAFWLLESIVPRTSTVFMHVERLPRDGHSRLRQA